MYEGNYIPIDNFRGGYCGNLNPNSLGLHQAADEDNIVLLPSGKDWRTRLGTKNVSGGPIASIQWNGVGSLLTSGGNTYTAVIGSTKFYGSTANSIAAANFTDYTGALSITSGSSNFWSFVTFGDSLIGFGGPINNPDAPITWSGTGNATALGGTPPSAWGCFTANNRVFAFRTNANPSSIYWSVLGNAGDWTGVGSGSATVGSLNDNQKITAAAVLSTNTVLVFKDNSTYQMSITSAPFPIYTLFDTTGCLAKDAVVVVEGTAYWVTKRYRMVSSNGEALQEYPHDADDLWDTLKSQDTGTTSFVHGFRQRGSDYDWIVWNAAGNSSNRNAIVWDLLNKCWLKFSTGYGSTRHVTLPDGTVYLAGFPSNGSIYQPDYAATYSDDNTGVAVTGYWRSGWISSPELEKITQVNALEILAKVKASGTIRVDYGFDFVADSANYSFNQTATGSETFTLNNTKLTGRGNFFQFKVSHSSSSIDSQIEKIVLRGKISGQKQFHNP